MSQSIKPQSSRRKFLSIMPACAISCLACPSAFAQNKGALFDVAGALQDKVHPFDEEIQRKITYRQFLTSRTRRMVELGKWLMEEMGHDEALESLKRFTTQRNLAIGKATESKSGNRTFREYTDIFRDIERWKYTITHEIVEDTEKAFAVRVSECNIASVYLSMDAAELGTAFVCHGDYAHAEGFNPNIKLVRDKTIMQGDAYCNHRYIWTA